MTTAAQSVTGAAPPTTNGTQGCVDRFDPQIDYFPAKASVEDAMLFGVEYHKSYKVVSVTAGPAGGAPARYLLVQCGTPVPSLTTQPSGTQVVMVPATSIFASSPTHIPALVDLGRLEVLKEVSRLSDLPDQQTAGIAGRVQEFAKSSIVDAELILSSGPSLLMTAGPPNASLSVVRDAGVPVVIDADWLEPTALGRAEWLKFIALFLNEDRHAQELYAAVKGRYQALRDGAALTPEGDRPLVMTGRSTRGTFAIAGGCSYVAGLIKDAGGRYVWADNTATGSTTVDLEAQFEKAGNADFWINGGGWKNHAAMLDNEPRYAEFKAYRERRVWVYERRLTPSGGNDYWSDGVTHPDVVLADLIKIFHPDLAVDHPFEWYMKVPE